MFRRSLLGYAFASAIVATLLPSALPHSFLPFAHTFAYCTANTAPMWDITASYSLASTLYYASSDETLMPAYVRSRLSHDNPQQLAFHIMVEAVYNARVPPPRGLPAPLTRPPYELTTCVYRSAGLPFHALYGYVVTKRYAGRPETTIYSSGGWLPSTPSASELDAASIAVASRLVFVPTHVLPVAAIANYVFWLICCWGVRVAWRGTRTIISHKRIKNSCCQHCGYIIMTRSMRCSECGRPIAARWRNTDPVGRAEREEGS